MSNYSEYRFAATSWQEFLEKYFEETERETRRDEETATRRLRGEPPVVQSPDEQLDEDIVSICFNNEGPLNASTALTDPPVKPDPRDPLGEACTCGSIKNYPRDTRTGRQRARKAAEPALPFGPASVSLFR